MSPQGRSQGRIRPEARSAEGNPTRITSTGLWARVRSARQGWMQIFGIPDYERYLAHCAEHHPGEAVLSRRDFFARAIDRKYSKSGPRCC